MKDKMDPLPIIIAVVLFVVLSAIAVIVLFLVRRYRSHRKQQATREVFDSSIISRHDNGSVIATNRLSVIMGTPEASRVSYDRHGGTAQINQAYPNPTYAIGRVGNTQGADGGDGEGTQGADGGEGIQGADGGEGEGTLGADGGEHTQTNNTVINIRNSNLSHTYDNASEMFKHTITANIDEDVTYTSLRTSLPHTYGHVNAGLSTDQSNATQARTEDNVDNTTDEGNYMRMSLSQQNDLPSPTDTVTEPKWPHRE